MDNTKTIDATNIKLMQFNTIVCKIIITENIAHTNSTVKNNRKRFLFKKKIILIIVKKSKLKLNKKKFILRQI